MSRVVDDRVVQMQFENTNFERNVTQSMSTLDKLKAALSFKGVENNFDAVEQSTISLGKTFNAFETLATGVFLRLGQQATDWAERTIKAMSGVENIQAGFQKFGDITRATGTLIAQGFKSDEVEDQLARLNWFTDETSYNLSDMVDNISKFTAAGQGLPESADAMMGIALWAALSGQNAQTASRAMYQLSQAMATYMKRQDWMSIQNANMDTVEFRQKALDAAVAVGTLQKNTDGLYRTLIDGAKYSDWFSRDKFVESLTEGQWFTKDVMMKVFREYSAGVDQIYAYTEEYGVTASEAIEALGDQIDSFALKAFKAGQEARTWGDVMDSIKDAASTGWMALFKKIFGNYEQATKFYTELANRFYDIFVEPINQLNDAFLKWSKKGGRSIFIDSLLTLLGVVENVFFGIQDAYNQFFYGTDEMDEITTQQGYSLWKATNAFKDFAYELFHATENLDSFKSVLNGVFGIFDLLKQAAGAAIDTIFSLFGGLGPITDILGSAAAGIGDFIGNISKSSRESNFFGKAFETAFKPLFNIKATILEFVEKLTPKFSKAWNELAPQFDKLKPGIDKVKNSLKGFFDLFKGYWERLFTHVDVDGTISRLGKLWTKLRNVLFQQDENGLDIFDKLNNWLTEFSGDIDSATAWVQEHVSKLWAVVKEEFNKFVDWMINNAGPAWKVFREKATEAFDWIKGRVMPVWNTIKNGLSTAYDWIINHTDQLEEYFSKAWEFIKKVGSTIWSFLSGLFGGKNTEGDLGLTEAEHKLTSFLAVVKKITGVIGTVFSTLWKLISPILDGIQNSFQNMSFEGLGAAAAGGGLAVIGVTLGKFINSLKKSNILQGLNEILSGVGNVLDSFAHSLDAKALKEAAIGVGILVAAIFVLTTIPIEDVATTATVLAVFVKVFVKSIQDISSATTGLKIGKDGANFSSSNAGKTFLKMALGLVAVALALKIIASIPTDQLMTAATVVAVLVFVIGQLIKGLAMIQSGGKNITKNSNNGTTNVGSGNALNILRLDAFAPAATILAIGLALYFMAKTLQKITPLIQTAPDQFAAAAGTVFVAMIGMFAVAKALDKVKISGKSFLMWTGMAIAIYVLMKAMLPLTDLELGKLAQAVVAVGVLMAAMVGVAWGVNKLGAEGGKLAAFSASMLILSAVIYSLVGAVALMAVVLKMDTAKDAILMLGLLVAALALLVSQATKFTKGGDMFKFAAGLIVLSVALGAIVGVLYGLSEVAAGGHLLAAGVALGVILAAIVALSYAIGRVSAIEKGFKIIITSAYAIAAVVASAGAAIFLIEKALEGFSNGAIDFEKAADNMMRVVKRIMQELPELLRNLITTAVEVILSLLPSVGMAMFDTALDIIEGLLQDNKLYRLVDGLLTAIEIVLDGLNEHAPEIVAKLITLAANVISSLADSLVENAGEIGEAIDKLLASIIIAIGSIFTDTSNWFRDDEDGEIEGLFHTIFSSLDLEIGKLDWDTLGEAIFGDMWEGMKSTWIEITNWFDDVIADIRSFIRELLGLDATYTAVSQHMTSSGAEHGGGGGSIDSAAVTRSKTYDRDYNQIPDYLEYQQTGMDRYFATGGDPSLIPDSSELQKMGHEIARGYNEIIDSHRAATANSARSNTVTLNQTNNFQGNSTPLDQYKANNSMIGKIGKVLGVGLK